MILTLRWYMIAVPCMRAVFTASARALRREVVMSLVMASGLSFFGLRVVAVFMINQSRFGKSLTGGECLRTSFAHLERTAETWTRRGFEAGQWGGGRPWSRDGFRRGGRA